MLSPARVEALEKTAALFPEDDSDLGWAVWASYDFLDSPPIGLGCDVISGAQEDEDFERACRYSADALYQRFGGTIEDPDPEDNDPSFGPFVFKYAWTKSPWPNDIAQQVFEVATADS